MIVFNLPAILVGIILVVVLGLLSLVLPDHYVTSDFGMILFTGIGAFISGICEIAGLRGRLFWLPMWLLGVIGTIALTYMEYGWTGIGVLAGILVGALILLLLLSYFIEKSAWKAAPRVLNELRTESSEKNELYWTRIKDALFIPGLMSYTHEICDHNVEVIDLMIKNGDHFEQIDTVREAMANGALRGNKIKIDSEITDHIEKYIAEQLALFEDDDADEEA